MELEVPTSPSRRSLELGVADVSAVRIDEREGVGRFLRLARPVHRGQAILVENPLFITPATAGELQALIAAVCDPTATQSATGNSAAPASGAAYQTDSEVCLLDLQDQSTDEPRIPLAEQLCLVIAQAALDNAAPQQIRALKELRGDTDRWRCAATALWDRLRPEAQEALHHDSGGFCEIYARVAANAHAASGSRAGLFHMGSLAEHSCAPSAFKEVTSPLGGQDAAAPSPALAQGPQLVFRAHRDLAEGDVVSISYVPEYLPTWRRQEVLKAGYSFDCSCSRCSKEPEAVCAFVCPECADGPCSPTSPVLAADFTGQSFSCEACGILFAAGSPEVDAFAAAERSTVLTEENAEVLHPYHHKILATYLKNVLRLPPAPRVQVVQQIMDAMTRLTMTSAHPILGRLSELSARAHMELEDHHAAVTAFRRAQELYGISHKGPPDAGHCERCHREEVQAMSGPLGEAVLRTPSANFRRGESFGRSPSLPSLAEGSGEDDAEGSGEGGDADGGGGD